MSVHSPADWTLKKNALRKKDRGIKAPAVAVWSPELPCNNIKKKKKPRWCPRLPSGSSFSACACAAPRLRQRPHRPCARPRAAVTETEALTAPGEDWAPCRAASAPSPTTCESSFSPLHWEPSVPHTLLDVCWCSRCQGYRVTGERESFPHGQGCREVRKIPGSVQCWRITLNEGCSDGSLLHTN